MSLRKIKFGNKELNKKKFYSSKEAILLDSVDLSKIVVSKKWKIDDKIYKYFCGYLNNDVIKPLCVILLIFLPILPIYFLKIDLTVNPVRDDIYLVAKLKIFNKINKTTFTNNTIPMEKNNYICIPATDVDSVLKLDKRLYPQTYLEQCKYKLKKRKIVNYINDEIIDENSDSDIDDASSGIVEI